MIRDLKIENRKNPLGIDGKIRFSWKLESDRQNVVQKGYQIQVRSRGKLVWDSGFVKTDRSVLCLLYTSPSTRDKRQSRKP